MDADIPRIPSGSPLSGVRPVNPRRERGGGGKREFESELEKEESSRERPEARERREPRPDLGRPEDESGSQLDLTA